MLKISDLTFGYGEEPLLKGVDLAVAEEEIVAIIGVSGVGKTTLFKLIAGILPLTQGTVVVAGQRLRGGAEQVSYLMQNDLLLPWRTVLDNVLLLRELGSRHGRREFSKAEALELIAELGLSGYERWFPRELSEGMRQRVAIARALLLSRPLLLLDEPFEALDVCLREQMYALIQRIQKHRRCTILLVTHDFRDALVLADRVILLAGGAFQREWTIPPDVKRDPERVGVYQQELRQALLGGRFLEKDGVPPAIEQILQPM